MEQLLEGGPSNESGDDQPKHTMEDNCNHRPRYVDIATLHRRAGSACKVEESER